MSLSAQTIKIIETNPLVVLPFIKTRGLDANGMRSALELFGPKTLGSWSLNVLFKAKFISTFGLRSSFVLIRPAPQRYNGCVSNGQAEEIAKERGYLTPTFEAGFYLAEWLIENRGQGFDFEYVIIMHEQVSCGEDSGSGPKILAVLDNQEIRGVFPGPGKDWCGNTVFAYQLPEHFK